MTDTKQLDVLAIGDIVIDAFIRLKEAEIIYDENKQNPKLSMDFGAKLPYESVEICNAVGNAANAAVSASRLGARSGLLTYVGADQNGKDCIESLTKDGVDTTLVHTEEGKKTNYHYVLWYDVDRTILVKHEKFSYSFEEVKKGIVNPKWLYVSSLGENSLMMYEHIAEYLKDHDEVNLAFQPGVFDMKMGVEKLNHIYSRANAICVNVEEAQHILGESSRDLKVLLKKMSDLGPKTVLITDGFEGAYAYEKNMDGGEKFLYIPIYPHSPFERTGAGDAFFSTVVTCLSLGKTIEEAITWGPVNSMSVVQKIGAQEGLLTREKLEEYLKNAPEDYKLKEI
jgi:sugar/nucleoside kinase (ribokinase family)